MHVVATMTNPTGADAFSSLCCPTLPVRRITDTWQILWSLCSWKITPFLIAAATYFMMFLRALFWVVLPLFHVTPAPVVVRNLPIAFPWTLFASSRRCSKISLGICAGLMNPGIVGSLSGAVFEICSCPWRMLPVWSLSSESSTSISLSQLDEMDTPRFDGGGLEWHVVVVVAVSLFAAAAVDVAIIAGRARKSCCGVGVVGVVIAGSARGFRHLLLVFLHRHGCRQDIGIESCAQERCQAACVTVLGD